MKIGKGLDRLHCGTVLLTSLFCPS